jgi:hypothetical protein
MAARTQHIDDLVATYAPRGRAQLQSGLQHRLRKTAYSALAAVLVVTAGAAAWQYDVTARWRAAEQLEREQAQTALTSASSQLQQAEKLRMALAQELQIIVQQRNELQAQQAELRSQQTAMGDRLAALADQKQLLDEQRLKLASETDKISATAAQISARRAALGAERERVDKEGPELTAALQQIRTQRQELDDEHKRFRAQRELLEHEISRLNEQRTALQDQQQKLKAEWESLQSLMEQAARNDQPAPAAPAADDDLAQAEAPLPTGMLIAAAETSMQDNELGEIRGGVDIGSQRDISIGLSRIVDINGVQQYSSTFQFNGMNAASYNELASMQAVVVQNGPGNQANPDMGAYTGSLPLIIQNTLDNQHIMNASVLDVTITNVASKAADVAASIATSNSLAFQK